MQATIHPAQARGSIVAPPSKSHAQRCIAAALLAHSTSILQNMPDTDDVVAALNIAHSLGAEIERTGDTVVINPPKQLKGGPLHCGESALCMRMFAPIAALADIPCTLEGTGSLLTRPMDMLAESLAPFGITVTTTDGHAPLRLQGHLHGGFAKLDGGITSQVVTGLLLALPRCPEDSRIRLSNPVSLPYIRMTLDVLNTFGVTVEHSPEGTEYIIPGNQTYRGSDVQIEGDWSGAAFMLVAGALGGPVTVAGLPNENRPDGGILSLLQSMGAEVQHSGDAVTVCRGDLRPLRTDISQCPDLLPPLVALAVHSPGHSRITGVERLQYKESNRIAALITGFGALGAKLSYADDCLHIHGGTLGGGCVSSIGDHRIAMALAIGALHATGPVTIDNAACVSKSWPGFFRDLSALGISVTQP